MLKALVICCIILSSYTYAASVTITTAPWHPYINDKNGGTAADLLQQIYSQDDIEINWLVQNYDLAFMQVANKQKLSSFPYFKTPEREASVRYSRPVFQVTSKLYYNRQFNNGIKKEEVNNYRVGQVAGYSYGANIDHILSNTRVYGSEEVALTALFKNEIDVLPMTESVMHHLLNTKFAPQKLLVKAVPGLSDTASLHLIAARTEQGEAIIKQLNILLDNVAHLQSLDLAPVPLDIPADIAKLKSSEGYPAILAQSDTSAEPKYFTLPQGTKVLVIEWSNKLIEASTSDRIYKNMMDVSKVVILNGPLVGKEVFVRNMHIELL